MDKVSVILTSYNHADFIGRATESVLNQTHKNLELIIWDDASTDNSWDIITYYKEKDNRINAFRNDTRKRGVRNINKAIELSTGDYIAIHHSDDMWDSTKLEKQLNIMHTMNLGAVFTLVNLIDEDEKIIGQNMLFQETNKSRYEWLRFFFFNGNALCHPSALIKKKCFDECGMYSESFYQLVDFDMWVRLCMKYDIYILEEKLTYYRVLRNNKNTSAPTQKAVSRSQLEHYFILKNYLRLTDMNDLLNIFPEIKLLVNIPEHVDSKYVPFLLGLMACECRYEPKIQLFGCEILFNVLKSPGLSKEIRYKFGFDDLKFIEIMGETNIFSDFSIKVPIALDFIVQNDNFVLWGAGSYGQNVKKRLEEMGKTVLFFLDNDANKKNSVIDGISVKHPSEIERIENKIIIASMGWPVIAKQLEKDFGLEYVVDFL